MTRTQSFLMGAAGAFALLIAVVGVAWAADIFTIDQNGNVRLVVTDAGNVGIGTTDPRGASNSRGITLYPSGDYAGFELKGVSSTLGGGFIDFGYPNNDFQGRIIYTNSDNKMQFFTSATSNLAIDTAGNVGIGTGDPKTKLHVTGLPEYADNAAALAAGLTAGAFYRTGELLKVVY